MTSAIRSARIRPGSGSLMGRRRDTPDFTRSNKLSALKYQPTSQERELTRRLIASTSAHEREALGQKLLDDICRALKISRTRLRVSDERQPHKLRGGKLAYKLYGAYYCASEMIEIANLTSIREQVVAGKTFLDTLIHELMHHVDRQFLRIPSTPHSPGFYARIEDLKANLMRKKGKEEPSPQETAWQRPKDLKAALDMAISGARLRDQRPSRSRPHEATPDDIAPEKRKPRWTPQGESVSPAHALPEDAGSKNPLQKPPRTQGSESISPNHPEKDASMEKEPQLSFDFQ